MTDRVKVQLDILPKTRRALRILAAVNDVSMGKALDRILADYQHEETPDKDREGANFAVDVAQA